MEFFLSQINLEILNSLAEGVYIIDKDFKIHFINTFAETILKRNSKDVLGKLCKNLCDSIRCEIGCPIDEVIRTGKKILELDSIMRCHEGNQIHVKLNASAIRDAHNSVVGVIISFRKTNHTFNLPDFSDFPGCFKIIGISPKMQEIFNTIEEISKSEAPVLILGETGVGKELIANAIYQTSLRKGKPFVKINCSALPPDLLASELFGHVKGAYTNALKDRIGRFDYANGGTIFLDEIGEMSADMQVKLLRVLQFGTFEQVGDSVTRKVNVRIIAATNKNLEQGIIDKNFRQDLFFRLNVIQIVVPPLRERKVDISYLAEYFVNKYATIYKKNVSIISNDVMNLFLNYSWPGNIRELENAIEYAIVRSKREDSICICSIPPFIRNPYKCFNKNDRTKLTYNEQIQELLSLLKQNNWNQTRVAKIMGINRSTVYRRLKSLPDEL